MPKKLATGAGAAYVKRSAGEVADVPTDVVTVTSTVSAACGGLVAVIEAALVIVQLEAAVLPNFTEVAPVKPVPVMVTDVPPAVVPDTGEMPVTVGGYLQGGKL